MRTADENRRAGIAYHAAYFIVPRRALGDVDCFLGAFDDDPDLTARTHYLDAARERGEMPHADDVPQVRGHVGCWGGDCRFAVIEYPRYPAIDLIGAGVTDPDDYVLAPYFSAVIHDRERPNPVCFVLGQSPDAWTTLRGVSPTMNANLGPGASRRSIRS